ncbi:unnamed protein product, partial [Rotaria magnacalcarata]
LPTGSKTWTKHYNRQYQALTTNSKNENGSSVDTLKISKHALKYASEYHYPPFKLECNPMINDKNKVKN